MLKKITDKIEETVNDQRDQKTLRLLILVLGACFIAWCLVVAIM